MKSRKKQDAILLFLVSLVLFSNSLRISKADPNTASFMEVCYVKGYPNDPSLVLYLPLLEGKDSRVFDISGFGNHGTLKQNGATSWLAGGGLHFNGKDDCIIVDASTSLECVEKTLIVQFMWDGKGNDTELYIYDDGYPHNGALIAFVHPKTSRVYVDFITDTGKQKNLWHGIIPNEIYTFVFSFDGKNYHFLLNKMEKSSSLEESGELTANHNVCIGSNYVRTRRWFSGNIYTVKVFNRSLSANEIVRYHTSLQETPRADPQSKYVIGGWVVSRNDSLLISEFEGVQISLNRTYVTSIDCCGVYRFVFDLPLEPGNYTFEVMVENMTSVEGARASVVVDRVVVSEIGSTSVWTGQEATAWFKLKSEFDGQLVASGMVNLNGGLAAIWNPNELRWEYSTTRHSESSLSLLVESIIWDKYGITALNIDGRADLATIKWQHPTWFTSIVLLLSSVSPALWGVVIVLLILVAFVRLGIIDVETDKPPEPIAQLRQQVDSLLEQLSEKDRRFALLHQFFHELLDENPPPEVLEFLRDYLPDIVKHLTEHQHPENHLDHRRQ